MRSQAGSSCGGPATCSPGRAGCAGRRDGELKVGDQDSLSLTSLDSSSPKLIPRFVGPIPVARALLPVAYELRLPPTLNTHPRPCASRSQCHNPLTSSITSIPSNAEAVHAVHRADCGQRASEQLARTHTHALSLTRSHPHTRSLPYSLTPTHTLSPLLARTHTHAPLTPSPAQPTHRPPHLRTFLKYVYRASPPGMGDSCLK